MEKPVEIYRCLTRKGHVFSVRQNGLVVGHTSNFCIKDCEYFINKSGKDRAINTGQRNVHAYVKGYISDTDKNIVNYYTFELKYDPFSKGGFFYKVAEKTTTPVLKSYRLFTHNSKLYIEI